MSDYWGLTAHCFLHPVMGTPLVHPELTKGPSVAVLVPNTEEVLNRYLRISFLFLTSLPTLQHELPFL